MQSLRLSLIATACILAISACSSNKNPSRYPEQPKQTQKSEDPSAKKNAEAAEEKRLADETAKKEEEKRLAEETAKKEEEKRLADETAKKEEEKRLAEETAKKEEEKRLTEETAKKEEEKRLAEETAKKEKEKRLAEETAKKEEEKRLADEAAKKTEIAKSFTDNGTDKNKISYVSGGVIVVEGDKLNHQVIPSKSTDLNQLVIDGKTITLFSKEVISERQNASQNDTYNINEIKTDEVSGKVGSLPKSRLGNEFTQMRFGYITDKNGKSTLFVQGHLTPLKNNTKSPFNYYFYTTNPDDTETLRELPATGRFQYEGYAFYGKNNEYQQLGVNALADLDNKKVKIELKEEDKTRLTLGGTIDGNSFAGNYQGVEMKGAFYGTKGQDIGGLFYQSKGTEKDFNGVFGATQRDCGYSGCATPEEDLKAFEINK